ncbi:hypothetical protein COCOBI_09-5420 [Coccomyxa sp. Obi]|nr:hypothetical protein COCOBI_09-5420 [Coccomyxa sp. Obi]
MGDGSSDPGQIRATGHEPEHPRHQGCLSSLKRAARRLKRNVYALHLAVQDPECGWAPRLLAVLVVAYAVSPIDLIPDFIPILGILDDLLLLPGLIWLAIRLIPDHVWEHALERAEVEPLLLGHNWVAAAIIFILWDALLLFGIYMVVVHFGTPYWQQRWYVWVAVAGAVLVVAEVSWSVCQLHAEKRAAHARQEEGSVSASLLGEGANNAV